MKVVMEKKINKKWDFVDDWGSFEWTNPHTLNQLYFPICNEAGLMGSVTPTLNGDSKTGQHTFLLLPVSVEDLHNNRSARNFWIYSEKLGPYSLTGNSAKQNSDRYTSRDRVEVTLHGEMLAHHLIRNDEEAGIKSEIINFCPVDDFQAELMWVQITNISAEPIQVTPTSAIPIFGRSAENIRDHKHATSLIHRQERVTNGVIVTPVIYHDERGHKANDTSYYVLGVEGNGKNPAGQFPTVMEFIGEGGSFDWPRAVVENLPPFQEPPNRRDGMEAMGAVRFKEVELLAGESMDYIVVLGVTQDKSEISKVLEKYGSTQKVQIALEDNRRYWKARIDRITFEESRPDFSNWMRWVALQPILRKIYGCSFLPHHDYGKGGRGWRDLWQDCLAFLLQQPEEVREVLLSNFGGVRSDGTNATIIGKGIGNFVADRNNISRVWMDHGVWPYFTLKLYIDQTGDFDILLEKVPYWLDHQMHRGKKRNQAWTPEMGNQVKTKTGKIYEGTVLEHILVQHLTCFFNVGDHNNIKLEEGDWNDQLDMAPDRGETVPFTAFYGSNLISLSEALLELKKRLGTGKVQLAEEVLALTSLIGKKIDHNSVKPKRNQLKKYLESVEKGFSGKKGEVSIEDLAGDLNEKGEWLLNQVRTKEWIDSKSGSSFFNGYYNNDGNRVDGDQDDGLRMNLTAQTFPTFSGAATNDQVKKSYESAFKNLKDPNTGGYRLTTPLGPNTFNFGRGFALIYGEKENGAMFSHMAVMYTNALYKRGFVKEGYEVFSSIYNLCNDTEKAKIYPGIPEYITHEGRGMYHYLTGSASWMLMTVLTQIFGVRGELGDLILNPKLVSDQFRDGGKAKVSTLFGGKRLEITYTNPNGLDYGEYEITRVMINGEETKGFSREGGSLKISRKDFGKYFSKDVNTIEVFLDK